MTHVPTTSIIVPAQAPHCTLTWETGLLLTGKLSRSFAPTAADGSSTIWSSPKLTRAWARRAVHCISSSPKQGIAHPVGGIRQMDCAPRTVLFQRWNC